MVWYGMVWYGIVCMYVCMFLGDFSFFLFNHPTALGLGPQQPRKAMVQGGYRGYRLAGRWRPSPLGGRFKEIRFGDKKNTRPGKRLPGSFHQWGVYPPNLAF